MSIALDIGVHGLRSLGCNGKRLLARGCRSQYMVLDDVEATRQLLDQIEIPFACCDGALVLLGDTTLDFAEMFGTESLPLFPYGSIPRENPPVRQILAALVERLLPRATESNEFCYMTIPGNPVNGAAEFGHEYEFFTRLVRLQGYKPVVLNSTMSLILTELAHESFTGLGFEFGAGSCNVSLSHGGNQRAQVSIPAGGQWIDMELASRNGDFTWDREGNRSLNTQRAARWKESFSGSLLMPVDEREHFLVELVSELITHVISEAAAEISRPQIIGCVPASLAIVLGGGIARLPGFGKLFEQILNQSEFPIQAKSIGLASKSDYSIARGNLIRAELETPVEVGGHRAA